MPPPPSLLAPPRFEPALPASSSPLPELLVSDSPPQPADSKTTNKALPARRTPKSPDRANIGQF
jgi:hypothetical protein